MNHFLYGVARAVAESFDLPSPILEIGSYKVAGQEEIADLRPLFPGKDYVGIDTRPGPGVDQVADVEALSFAKSTFGTVIAMSTFEHVPRFWRGFEEIHRVLRPDGVLFVCCPFYFHIHAYPSDYWRFTPEAFEVLLPSVTTVVAHHFRRVLLGVAQEHLEAVGHETEIAAANAAASRRLETQWG